MLQVGSDWCVSGENVRKAFESREFARAVEGKYVLAVYDEMDTPTEAVKAKNELVKDIDRHPFEGMGKPEGLKKNYSGLWSRRINREHRVVYGVSGDQIVFYSFRDHYGDKRKGDAISKTHKKMQ